MVEKLTSNTLVRSVDGVFCRKNSNGVKPYQRLQEISFLDSKDKHQASVPSGGLRMVTNALSDSYSVRYRSGTVNVDISALKEAVPEQVKTVRLIVTVGGGMKSDSGVACKAHVVSVNNPKQVATWKLVNGQWITEKEPKPLQESDDGEAAAYMARSCALLRKDNNPKAGGLLGAARNLAVKAKLVSPPENGNKKQRVELEQSAGDSVGLEENVQVLRESIEEADGRHNDAEEQVLLGGQNKADAFDEEMDELADRFEKLSLDGGDRAVNDDFNANPDLAGPLLQNDHEDSDNDGKEKKPIEGDDKENNAGKGNDKPSDDGDELEVNETPAAKQDAQPLEKLKPCLKKKSANEGPQAPVQNPEKKVGFNHSVQFFDQHRKALYDVCDYVNRENAEIANALKRGRKHIIPETTERQWVKDVLKEQINCIEEYYATNGPNAPREPYIELSHAAILWLTKQPALVSFFRGEISRERSPNVAIALRRSRPYTDILDRLKADYDNNVDDPAHQALLAELKKSKKYKMLWDQMHQRDPDDTSSELSVVPGSSLEKLFELPTHMALKSLFGCVVEKKGKKGNGGLADDNKEEKEQRKWERKERGKIILEPLNRGWRQMLKGDISAEVLNQIKAECRNVDSQDQLTKTRNLQKYYALDILKILNDFSGNGEVDAGLEALDAMTKLWVTLDVLEGSSDTTCENAARASVKIRTKEEFKQAYPSEQYVAMFVTFIKYVMRSNIPVSEIKRIETESHFAWLFEEHPIEKEILADLAVYEDALLKGHYSYDLGLVELEQLENFGRVMGVRKLISLLPMIDNKYKVLDGRLNRNDGPVLVNILKRQLDSMHDNTRNTVVELESKLKTVLPIQRRYLRTVEISLIAKASDNRECVELIGQEGDQIWVQFGVSPEKSLDARKMVWFALTHTGDRGCIEYVANTEGGDENSIVRALRDIKDIKGRPGLQAHRFGDLTVQSIELVSGGPNEAHETLMVRAVNKDGKEVIAPFTVARLGSSEKGLSASELMKANDVEKLHHSAIKEQKVLRVEKRSDLSLRHLMNMTLEELYQMRDECIEKRALANKAKAESRKKALGNRIADYNSVIRIKEELIGTPLILSPRGDERNLQHVLVSAQRDWLNVMQSRYVIRKSLDEERLTELAKMGKPSKMPGLLEEIEYLKLWMAKSAKRLGPLLQLLQNESSEPMIRDKARVKVLEEAFDLLAEEVQ